MSHLLLVCCVAFLMNTVGRLLPAPIQAEDQQYVEFDFSPIPKQRKWELTVKVYTDKGVFRYSTNAPGGDDPESLAEAVVASMKDAGVRAEVVEKVKVRVYSGKTDGKAYPATKGTVESPDLKQEELPKVKNPAKKG